MVRLPGMPEFTRKVIERHHSPAGNTVRIETSACMFCGKTGQVTMPERAWQEYDDGKGAQIQYAWPEGSPGEREQLINGTHPECFEQMFPPEEDEEDTQNVNYANGDTP